MSKKPLARRLAGLAIATVVVVGATSLIRPDASRVAGRAAARALDGMDFGVDAATKVRLDSAGADKDCSGVDRFLRARLGERIDETASSALTVRCTTDAAGSATVSLEGPAGKAARSSTVAVPTWWSAVPPALAVAWAFVLGDALLALLLAIIAGSWMLAGFDPIAGTLLAVKDQIGVTLLAPDTIKILVFTATLVGLVQVCVRSGGIEAFVRWLSGGKSSRKRTQRTTAGLGTLIFFDDYANTMVVGSAMRPMADRTATSRAKLAYLVDSTSAPIAGVALISTWIGMEIGLFEAQLADFMGLVPNGYGAFFAVLPYRFYCLLALVLVAILVWTGRDFGPMLKAEEKAAANPPEPEEDVGDASEASKATAMDGVGPVVIVLAGIMGAFAVLGAQADIDTSGSGPFRALLDRFIAASDYTLDILAWAGVCGTFVSLAWARARPGLPLAEGLKAYAHGLKILAPTLGVLVLAMSVRKLTDDLGTGTFLAALLYGTPAGILPVAVFCLSAAVSFCIGSSWATMGLLIPVAMPLANAAVSLEGAAPAILLATAASVLDGAIFGDHCSPISDTTVMSSAASGCPHIEHVRTQIPYALLGMAAAVVAGYGISVALFGLAWPGYVLGALGLYAAVRFVGRVPAAPAK